MRDLDRRFCLSENKGNKWFDHFHSILTQCAGHTPNLEVLITMVDKTQPCPVRASGRCCIETTKCDKATVDIWVKCLRNQEADEIESLSEMLPAISPLVALWRKSTGESPGVSSSTPHHALLNGRSLAPWIQQHQSLVQIIPLWCVIDTQVFPGGDMGLYV